MNRSNASGTSAGKPVPASNRCKQGEIWQCPVRAWNIAIRRGSIRQSGAMPQIPSRFRDVPGPPLLLQALAAFSLRNRPDCGLFNSDSLLTFCCPYNLPCTCIDRIVFTLISLSTAGQALPGASMRIVKLCLPAVLIASLFSSSSYAAVQDRIASSLTNGQTVALRGSVHRRALPQFDQGPVDPAMRMGTITLMTSPTAAQQRALTHLLAQQQDPKSSNYHKWSTPEQYADRFGMSFQRHAKDGCLAEGERLHGHGPGAWTQLDFVHRNRGPGE